jgi:hypothetical protein
VPPTFTSAAPDGLGEPDFAGPRAGNGGLLSDWAPAAPISSAGGPTSVRIASPVGGGNIVPLTILGPKCYQPRLSPDARWFVATVGEGTDYDVFVFSAGQTPGRWQLSQRSSIFPTWTKGGREIIFEEMN